MFLGQSSRTPIESKHDERRLTTAIRRLWAIFSRAPIAPPCWNTTPQPSFLSKSPGRTTMASRKSKILPENRSPKPRGAMAQDGRVRPSEALDDMLVARQPLVGMLQQDIEQLLADTRSADSGGVPPLTLEGAQRPQHWATRGMRYFLNE